MDDSKLWHLHGELYDLEPFLDKHPGGRSILIATRGLPDATPLFESYHAFANRTAIRKQLKSYRVIGPAKAPMYSYDGFYEALVQRARAVFGAKSDSESVMRRVKANNWWWFKIINEVVVMVACWIATFVYPPFADSARWRLVSGLFTGFVFISLGFNTMHDASHFAIKPRNHWANGLFLRAWTSWALWSGSYWMTHHVVRHHAFTGHPELDPDIQHARPFIRKSMESPRKKYISLPSPLKKVWQFAVLTASVFALLPGMFVGQILSYSIIWPLRRHLWKMPHPKRGSFDRQWWETAVSLSSLLSHFCFAPSIQASLGFLIGCNIAYAICILPDHDSFESAVENHVDSMTPSPPDWGEIQVRHSSDFGSGIWGRAFGEFAGGINFQIVHHLFPGVSHVHFPMLTQVVEEVCAEYKVPFVRHSTLTDALWSVARTFSLTMAPVKTVDAVTVMPMAEEILAKRILSDDALTKMKQRRMDSRQRGMDAVTGLLFGAWFTLSALAIAHGGRHLLVVPAALGGSLVVHWMIGAFAKAPKGKRCVVEDLLHNRRYRFQNVQKSSARLSFVLAALALDNLGDLGLFGVSTEYTTMLTTGMLGAELFSLVISGTFGLCPRRVLSDTVKLVLFTVLSYRAPTNDVFFSLSLITLDHFISLMLQSSRLAWPTSLVLHGWAAGLMASSAPFGTTMLAMNAILISI